MFLLQTFENEPSGNRKSENVASSSLVNGRAWLLKLGIIPYVSLKGYMGVCISYIKD